MKKLSPVPCLPLRIQIPSTQGPFQRRYMSTPAYVYYEVVYICMSTLVSSRNRLLVAYYRNSLVDYYGNSLLIDYYRNSLLLTYYCITDWGYVYVSICVYVSIWQYVYSRVFIGVLGCFVVAGIDENRLFWARGSKSSKISDFQWNLTYFRCSGWSISMVFLWYYGDRGGSASAMRS